MTKKERNDVYTKAFHYLITNSINMHPLPLNDICQKQGIEIIPLSKILETTGLSHRDIFKIWGNPDGIVQYAPNKNCKIQYKISYNDSQPRNRIRFTIAEELSHIICGHVNDKRFNMFTQTYDNNIYELYDQQARMCAGILLCSPKFYYKNYSNYKTADIAKICKISIECANIRCLIYDQYKQEIMKHPLYRYLPDPHTLYRHSYF